MAYFAADPSIKVIVVIGAGVRHTKRSRDACKGRARAGQTRHRRSSSGRTRRGGGAGCGDGAYRPRWQGSIEYVRCGSRPAGRDPGREARRVDLNHRVLRAAINKGDRLAAVTLSGKTRLRIERSLGGPELRPAQRGCQREIAKGLGPARSSQSAGRRDSPRWSIPRVYMAVDQDHDRRSRHRISSSSRNAEGAA